MLQAATRPKARRKPWLFLLGAALLAIAVGGYFRLVRLDPHAEEVRKLVSQLLPSGNREEPQASIEGELVRLGPRAYPELARILRAQDTPMDRWYDDARARLPRSLRRLLPIRESKDQLRDRAQVAIGELGPAASRALVGAIHDSVERGSMLTRIELLRTLYWSIPDSPKAVDTLRAWLSTPEPRRLLFGMKDADEIWPQVLQFAPLLGQWLKLPDQAREAADALGLMGTNALFAIPDLIDTFDQGVAGHPPNTNFVIHYSPGMEPLQRNRTAAISALGHIGLASSSVLAALERGLDDPQEDVRIFTADAIGQLGSKALPLLPKLLARLDTTNKLVLEYQIEAIGKMGYGAREAVPALRRWADPETVAALSVSQGIGRVVRWFDVPPTLPGGAAIALLLVAPPAAVGYGEVIARTLTPGRDVQWGENSVEKLRRLSPLAGEIVPQLEAALQDDRQWVRQLTAFQILSLKPDHTAAKMLLLTAMEQREPALRAQAAIYFWRLDGDIRQVLRVIRETLGTVKDNISQPPLNYASELGPSGMPLVPEIQALLTNQDVTIRHLAGKALRRIDPKALPPVNER